MARVSKITHVVTPSASLIGLWARPKSIVTEEISFRPYTIGH